jgi:hypothetical protein
MGWGRLPRPFVCPLCLSLGADVGRHHGGGGSGGTLERS